MPECPKCHHAWGKSKDSKALITLMRKAWKDKYGALPSWSGGKVIRFHQVRRAGQAGQLKDAAILLAFTGPFLQNAWYAEHEITPTLSAFTERIDHYINQLRLTDGDYI